MKRHFRKLAAAVTMAAAVGLVVVSSHATSGASSISVNLPPFPPDVGMLHLHLAAQDYFRFDAMDTATNAYNPGIAESLNISGCNVVAPLPSSVTITPTPNGGAAKGTVGLVGDSVGVQIKGEGNGTPCGQVNGTGQALDLTLAGSLANDEMDKAELDIEGKYGATVKADLYNNGTLVRTEKLTTNGTSDSGPDSGPSDNYRWAIPTTNTLTPFDEIKLSVDASTPAGAFSLEGGGDGTLPGPLGTALGTNDTLFHITNVDGILGCGSTATVAGTSTTANVSVQNQSGSGCAPVPYALSTGTQDGHATVTFQKSGGDNNVYRTTTTWPVEPNVYPVPATQIAYVSGPYHNMLWCNGTANAPTLPAPGEFWCIVDQHTVIVGNGQMQVSETTIGIGDPSRLH